MVSGTDTPSKTFADGGDDLIMVAMKDLDFIRGDEETAAQIAIAGILGSALTRPDGITGLRAFLGTAFAGPDGILGNADDKFDGGNIVLGGDGSDILEGRGGDDLMDGDMW